MVCPCSRKKNRNPAKRCEATTSSGKRCKNNALKGKKYCWAHRNLS
nr:hypothetical protein MarFTME_203 [Marseillevirus futianmevirus]